MIEVIGYSVYSSFPILHHLSLVPYPCHFQIPHDMPLLQSLRLEFLKACSARSHQKECEKFADDQINDSFGAFEDVEAMPVELFAQAQIGRSQSAISNGDVEVAEVARGVLGGLCLVQLGGLKC